MYKMLKIGLGVFLMASLFSCIHKMDDSDGLKLISWNCNNFLLSLDTLHAASVFLNAQKPDIICLQERPHTNLVHYDSIKKCFPTLPYKVTNGREDENLNVSIFSRYPVSNVKTWYFTDTYNKMIQADINRDGEMFRLYNVHLQTTSSGSTLDNCIHRYKQSYLLLSEIRESLYPVIICGDFNDILISYTVMNLITCLNDISFSFNSSYQKLGNLFKIDYILASPQWKKVHYELIPTSWSDHKIQKSILTYNE